MKRRPGAAAEGPSRAGPGVSLAAEEKEGVPSQDLSVSAVIFLFFNVKIPLKILFVESTRY